MSRTTRDGTTGSRKRLYLSQSGRTGILVSRSLQGILRSKVWKGRWGGDGLGEWDIGSLRLNRLYLGDNLYRSGSFYPTHQRQSWCQDVLVERMESCNGQMHKSSRFSSLPDNLMVGKHEFTVLLFVWTSTFKSFSRRFTPWTRTLRN